MNNEYLISIIVPVYNAEKYLNRCIELFSKTKELVPLFLMKISPLKWLIQKWKGCRDIHGKN